MNSASVRAVLCDIGGVLYVGDAPIPGAIEAVARIKRTHPIRFLTNTTQKTAAQVVTKLQAFGFDIDATEVITALDVTKSFLKSRNSSAEYLLTDDARAFFDDLDTLPCNYVVVGDAQHNFTYAYLNRAFRTLMAGGELLAAAKNRYFKDDDGLLSMDAGGFVAALEYAACKKARVIGKPSADFYRLACESMGVMPAQTLMIGDDIESDVGGAQNADLLGALVKTGKFSPQALECDTVPDLILESIADISL